MSMPSKRKKQAKPFAELVQILANKLRPPFGIVLGSPGEVAELVQVLPDGETTCYQMDLFQSARLIDILATRSRSAIVESRPDLWDLHLSSSPGRGIGSEGEATDISLPDPHPQPLSQGERGAGFQTLIYPVPLGGERALKLDMVEQAFHVLKPQGTLIVLSPYDKDDLFPAALKKVFGRLHTPMEGDNKIFWCQHDGERPRRRHEMTYHVRVDPETSYCFLSRPGVFGYGFYDEGARALTEVMELEAGQRVLDLGCGVGTNGILAARQVGPTGFVAFADSNVRAIALAELNAHAIGLISYQTCATHTLTEWPDASFDVVLANPPYYAHGSIIRLFIERSKALLRAGGILYLVTKQVHAAGPILQEHFPEPVLFENRGYVIFRTQKD
jgi:16S rRNA G1207 methylase RsmC